MLGYFEHLLKWQLKTLSLLWAKHLASWAERAILPWPWTGICFFVALRLRVMMVGGEIRSVFTRTHRRNVCVFISSIRENLWQTQHTLFPKGSLKVKAKKMGWHTCVSTHWSSASPKHLWKKCFTISLCVCACVCVCARKVLLLLSNPVYARCRLERNRAKTDWWTLNKLFQKKNNFMCHSSAQISCVDS